MGCIPWGLEESDTAERLHFHFSLLCIGEGNGNPLQCSCLENPRDRGAWWAALFGVAQSWTRLKRCSSSSCPSSCLSGDSTGCCGRCLPGARPPSAPSERRPPGAALGPSERAPAHCPVRQLSQLREAGLCLRACVLQCTCAHARTHTRVGSGGGGPVYSPQGCAAVDRGLTFAASQEGWFPSEQHRDC